MSATIWIASSRRFCCKVDHRTIFPPPERQSSNASEEHLDEGGGGLPVPPLYLLNLPFPDH